MEAVRFVILRARSFLRDFSQVIIMDRKKLKIISYIIVFFVALFAIFCGIYMQNPSGLSIIWTNLLVTIGSSVTATLITIALDRAINGNPFSEFNEKILLFKDTEDAGLKRIHIDRNKFLHSDEFISYIRNSNKIRIHGTALGFLVRNEELYEEVRRIAGLKDGRVEILVANPKSKIVAYRDSEEKWNGQLKEQIKNTIIDLFNNLKLKHIDNVKLYVFSGEIHNSIISTNEVVIVNPYAFGKRGWLSPALVFSRTNQKIIDNFDEQMNEMIQHGKINEQPDDVIFSLENTDDLKKII